MTIDYMALAEKLGTKLNTMGEAAFKIGVAGAKFEAIGDFVALALPSLAFGVLSYKLIKKGFSYENNRAYREHFCVFGIVTGIIATASGLFALGQLPSLFIALNSPEYLFIKQLIHAVK